MSATYALTSKELRVHQLVRQQAQAFGQSESLTTRLKHIIGAYVDGPGILMELIQNAGKLHPINRPLLSPPYLGTPPTRCSRPSFSLQTSTYLVWPPVL